MPNYGYRLKLWTVSFLKNLNIRLFLSQGWRSWIKFFFLCLDRIPSLWPLSSFRLWSLPSHWLTHFPFVILFPQLFTSSFCLCLTKLWACHSFSKMPKNELHYCLQRKTWGQKYGFLKDWFFSLSNPAWRGPFETPQAGHERKLHALFIW